MPFNKAQFILHDARSWNNEIVKTNYSLFYFYEIQFSVWQYPFGTLKALGKKVIETVEELVIVFIAQN